MVFIQQLKFVLSKYIKLFQIAKVKKKNYVFVILLTVLTVILDAAGISVLLPIGEYVLKYETGKVPDTQAWKVLQNIFLYLGIKADITPVVIFAIVLIFLRQGAVFTRGIIIDLIDYKLVKDFREKLFAKFLVQDVYHIKQHSTGIYNNSINLEVANIGKAIILPVENISGIIQILSYLSLMLFISIKATLVVIIFMVFTGILLKNFLYYIRNISSKIIKINNNFSQNLVDRLIAVKLIRVSNKTYKEQDKNKEILREQFLNNIKLSRVQRIIDSTIEPLLLIVAIPVIIIAITLNFPLAKLGVFIIILARFIPVFKITLVGMQSHFHYYASITNMLKLIDKLDSQKEKRKGKLPAPKHIESIKFSKIYFNYENSKNNILNNFSCQIKGGVVNALLGTSGSGKTTVVNMIPRLLEPSKGKILINNINLNTIHVDRIRDICTYIEQKPTFIRGTIIEHITYNNLKTNRAKAIEAAKLANAHDFIMSFPENYDHQLGEGGVGLSGGQLQRLDITRGLALGTPLMILDEPTSNLDSKNTKELLLTLKRINQIKKTTIIIVSHDDSVLKYCDNIIQL